MKGLAWFSRRRLPMFLQMEASECGLASLAMLGAYHGIVRTLSELRREMPVSRKGITVQALVRLAAMLGLQLRPVRLEPEALVHLRLPCMLHWDMEHFVVLRSIVRGGVVIHDPAVGVRRVSLREFGQRFSGVAIECEPAHEAPPRGAPAPSFALRQWLGNVPGLRRNVLRLLVYAAALEVLAVLTPVLLQWVADDALPQRNRSLLDGLAVGFALLVVAGAALEMMRGWLVAVVSRELKVRWMSRVLSHLLKLPLDYFERRHSGDVVASFGSITAVQRTLTTGFIEALVDGTMAAGTLAMMAWYSPAGAGLAGAVVLAYAVLRIGLQAPLRRATAEQIVQAARQETHLLETLRGMQGIRLFGRTGQRHHGWSQLIARQTHAELRLEGLHVTHAAMHQLLFGLLRVLVIWIAAQAVLRGDATLGLIFAFLAYLDQFTRRTAALVDRVLDISLLRLHVDRVQDIAATPAEPDDPPLSGSAMAGPPGLTVRNLSFAYSLADDPVLRDVNLEIRPGECVALVGPSGCGKTTLVKILLGLMAPTAGDVLVDGVPLSAYGRHRLREAAGTVMQDDILFTGSLADNISFFDPRPDVDHIVHCATLAALHDDILAMPMAYATLAGKAGVGLSGGQRQRLMLARALYKRPRLLVLDEATSHLDVMNERSVNDAIRRLPLTRVIVAHRPETIAMADRVVHLQAPVA